MMLLMMTAFAAGPVAVERASPELRVLAFGDLPGDCDPDLAASAACLEEVRFLDWEAGGTNLREIRALWRNLGRVHARLWEDLAYRVPEPKDLLTESGFTGRWPTLGPTARHWDLVSNDGGTFAIPERAAWLRAPAWTGPQEGAWFPRVVHAHASYEAEIPGTAVLRGRFAERLGFNGKPHDFMVMDADIVSGGPFFEQLYPFQTAMEGNDPRLKPLSSFEPASTLSADLTPIELARLRLEKTRHLALQELSPEGLREFAATEFETFSKLVSVQVAQYAMENYTPNHMRVLSALTAMQVPPPDDARPQEGAAGLNAATRGQTDPIDVVTQRLDTLPLASLRTGFSLRIEGLPREVVERYLDHFATRSPPTEALLEAVNGAVAGFDPSLVVAQPARLTDASRAAITRWAIENAAPGIDARILADRLERSALGALLGLLPRDPADLRGWAEGTPTVHEYESWIFLDHVQASVAASFTPTKTSSPTEVTTRTTAAWVEVLGRHGRRAAPISQGLGGVDPTAVCARGERAAAQSEPSVSAVYVDALVAAKDKLGDEDLLWEARHDLPFVLVDDPRRNQPIVARLVGLPEGRALYRVRWPVWTGWHLLWNAKQLSGSSERLVARVAAICSDMVLAPPDLVPTLVRAAMLDDTHRPWRPTVPPGGGPRRQATSGAPPASEVDWLTTLIRAPLLALAGKDGLLVEVFDSSLRDHAAPADVFSPRTPYARHTSWVGRKAWLQVAGWATMLGGDKPVVVAPGFPPGASVETESVAPRWGRRSVSDWHVVGGLGTFPWRAVTWTCTSNAADYDVVAPCPEGAQVDTTAGVSADIGFFRTLWPIDDPRIAFEVGPEIRLDVLYPQLAGLQDDGRSLQYTWALQPQAGLDLGVRWSPDPGPLSYRGARGALWGAERADGRSRTGRSELGLRVGGLMGPGFNGLEGTLLAELWAGIGVRSPNALNASLTPYDPAMLVGIFARGQYQGLLLPGASRRLVLDHGWTVVGGMRFDLQFKGTPPKPPAPPKVPEVPESPVPGVEVPS